MRFCQAFETKPGHVESYLAANQFGLTRSTAQSLSLNKRLTKILKPLPIAKLSCAESAKLLISIKKGLGLSLIPWAPEPDIRHGLN